MGGVREFSSQGSRIGGGFSRVRIFGGWLRRGILKCDCAGQGLIRD